MPEELTTALTAVKTDALATIGEVAAIALPIFGLILVFRIALRVFSKVAKG